LVLIIRRAGVGVVTWLVTAIAYIPAGCRIVVSMVVGVVSWSYLRPVAIPTTTSCLSIIIGSVVVCHDLVHLRQIDLKVLSKGNITQDTNCTGST
jgi:hypothetical protein